MPLRGKDFNPSPKGISYLFLLPYSFFPLFPPHYHATELRSNPQLVVRIKEKSHGRKTRLL